ncbi:MAG TPA: biopolymer transporter ExbD [Oceanipulchritudo sp.]|nr:biopolymer transporter ExbD [Oceanipulchritudo sp.]
MRRRSHSPDTPEIPIAPMIDCVFLMLVYFMTTSSLERSEADLIFPAGQPGAAADPLRSIDEQQLGLDDAGILHWNGSSFEMLGGAGVSALRDRLERFRQTCLQAGSEPSLQLLPEGKTPHQAIVTALDTITLAGIEAVHFP